MAMGFRWAHPNRPEHDLCCAISANLTMVAAAGEGWSPELPFETFPRMAYSSVFRRGLLFACSLTSLQEFCMRAARPSGEGAFPDGAQDQGLRIACLARCRHNRSICLPLISGKFA